MVSTEPSAPEPPSSQMPLMEAPAWTVTLSAVFSVEKPEPVLDPLYRAYPVASFPVAVASMTPVEPMVVVMPAPPIRAAAVLPAVAALTVPLIVPVVRENSASSP